VFAFKVYKNAIDKIKIRWYYSMADVKQWITVHPNGSDSKGQPIPVMEGQSKGEAVKSFINKHKSEVKELNKKSTDELKKEVEFETKAKFNTFENGLNVNDNQALKIRRLEQKAKELGFANLKFYNNPNTTDEIVGSYTKKDGSRSGFFMDSEGEIVHSGTESLVDSITKSIGENLSDSEKNSMILMRLGNSNSRSIVWRTDDEKPLYKDVTQVYNPLKGWMNNSKGILTEEDYNTYRDNVNEFRGGVNPIMASKIKVNNQEYPVYDKMPEGYRELKNATTAPRGYRWITNSGSMFDKNRKLAFIKDHN
jgi:hypothetical protein